MNKKIKPPATPQAVYQTLLPWERATLSADDLWLPGWLPVRLHKPFTWFSMGLFIIGFHFGALPEALLAAPVFARLLALDLTTYTLPDIYTYPLLAMGLAAALATHHPEQAAMAAGLLVFAAIAPKFPITRGLGGGDFKLLAALLAWLPLNEAAFALAIGCILWLPLAFWKPKTPQPFGAPLILGWSIILAMPHLPEGLLRPMFGG